MQLTRKHLTIAFLGVVAVMAAFALAGNPLIDPAVLAGIGMLPVAMSGEIDLTFVLEGANTTNTNFYPSGSGAGTVVKVTTWVQITGVMNMQPSGGEAKTVNYKFMESDVEFSINDGFTATSYTFDLDADQIGSPGYTALKDLTEVQTDTVARLVKRNGSITLQPCTVALNEAENFTEGTINNVKVSLNGNNRAVRYQS